VERKLASKPKKTYRMVQTIKKNIAIIGGGSSAHTIIPLLSKADYNINLLTSKPKKWKKKITLEHHSENGEIIGIFKGELNIISDDPKQVTANVDIIILCMPVSQYKIALNRIAPYLDKKKKIYIGTIFGQGGFNWIVDEIKEKYSLSNIVTFAYCLIPWICRTKEYGNLGILYGIKKKNIVAVSPLNEYEILKNTLFRDICNKKAKTYLSKDFISLTMSITNQIIHPSRMYGLYLENPHQWNKKEDVPYFYRDFDDTSAEIFRKVDDDYSKIRSEIKKSNKKVEYKYLLDYLSLDSFYFGSSNKDIKTLFSTSKSLRFIKTPVVKNKDNKWEINTDHRFFTDDVFYGLCIAKWFAQQFSLEVPMIDEILEWASKMLGVSIIKSGKLNQDCILNGVDIGTPDKYNLSLKESLV